MKSSLLFALIAGVVFATALHLGMGLIKPTEDWPSEFPAEGLVMDADGVMSFENIPREDIKNLSRVGFPQALGDLGAKVRHLVIYQDCSYFFTADHRVIVMTAGSADLKPRLVETMAYDGSPHDFRNYRKELLPSP